MGRSYNPGITILKMLAVAGVVWSHFGVGLGRVMMLAVPTFVLLSCYLTADVVLTGSTQQLGRRLLRFWMPFLVWGAVAWVIVGFLNGEWSLRSLLLQLAFGHTVCPPLYYLVDMIAVTGILWTWGRISRRMSGYLAVIAAAYAIQYSGLNEWIFGGLDESCRYTLGRVCEFLPFGVCGIVLREYRPLWMKRYRKTGVFAGLVLAAFGLCVAKVIDADVPGFVYSGAGLALQSVGLCLVFILVGEQALASRIPRASCLMWLFSQSAGIYFLHFSVGLVCMRGLGLRGGLVASMVVWLVSFVLSCGLSCMKRPKFLGF